MILSGEGTFGKVLQARAEGIVEGAPQRNIVAIKTTKGILAFLMCALILCDKATDYSQRGVNLGHFNRPIKKTSFILTPHELCHPSW